ncbi:MAG: hypothetical protein Q8P20_03970 [bacterium]|nr:hypothetical protein [bacterium]
MKKIIFTIKSIWTRFKIEIIIFCLVFGVRALYALVMGGFFGSDIFLAYSDAQSFFYVVNNLLHHGAFSQVIQGPLYYPDAIRTPGYPFFLAFFVLLKTPTIVIAMAQHVLAGLMGVMMYRIGLGVFKSRFVGLFASIIFAFEPASIYWGNLLMSDNLFTFLLFLGLYLFLQKRFLWSAFVMGLSILTRPISLYFLPLFIGMFVLEYWRGAYDQLVAKISIAPKQFFWKIILIFIFVPVLVMSPWLIRNKLIFDTWQFSSAGWVNLYLFTAEPYADKYNIPLLHLEMPADYPIQNSVIFSYDFQNTGFYKDQIYSLFIKNPILYTTFHIGSAIKGLGNTGYRYLIDYVIGVKFSAIPASVLVALFYVGQLFWAVLLALVFLGFWRKGTRIPHAFLFSIFFVNTILLGNSANGQGGRYQLPIEPIILLLAGNGVWLVISLIKERRRSPNHLTT